jgi:cyclic dehypoxanthinyl futalosine synthase
VHHLTLDEIKDSIRELGYTPRRRNVFYQLLEDEPANGDAMTRQTNGALPILN